MKCLGEPANLMDYEEAKEQDVLFVRIYWALDQTFLSSPGSFFAGKVRQRYTLYDATRVWKSSKDPWHASESMKMRKNFVLKETKASPNLYVCQYLFVLLDNCICFILRKRLLIELGE